MAKKFSVAPLVESPLAQSTVTPRCLSIREAAKLLGATAWFVRTLVWERRVPFLKLGKRIVFDVRDLEQFIEAQKEGAR